jgi:hypothetical protein
MMECCFHLDNIYVLLSIRITNNKVTKSDGLGTDYWLAGCLFHAAPRISQQVKLKVKFTLEQAMKAQRKSISIALLCL